MLVTVAICTWNRAELLANTLRKFTELSLPNQDQWELIVVNNNSTDSTDDVLLSFKNKLPLRRIFESKPGLSNARNSAVREARGDYIIWTDDDVLVDSDWLSSYIRAFKQFPDAAVFGGPIKPWFEGVPPAWLLNSWNLVSSAFAARDFGEKTISFDVAEGRLPFGANYGIRMKEQKAFLYDPELGLKEENIVLGEEIKVIKAILISGGEGWWVPDAKVLHWIPKKRQSFDYLKKYFIGKGRTLIKQGKAYGGVSFQGIPFRLLRRYFKTLVRSYLAKMIWGEEVYVKEFINKNIRFGQILELRRRHLLRDS